MQWDYREGVIMFRKTSTLGVGVLALLAATQVSSQTLFTDEFDGTYSSDKFYTTLSQYLDFAKANPDLTTIPEQIAASPWVWSITKPSISTYQVSEANSTLTITTSNGVQTNGVGFSTVHPTTDFNFFGPEGANPSTFRRVFRASGISIGGEGVRDQNGDLVYPGMPLRDNYYVAYFSVVSGNSLIGSGNPWDVPAITAWANGGKGFGLIVSSYANAGDFAVAKKDVLAEVLLPTLPKLPTAIELELGPTSYKVTYFFAGGGMFLEGDHGLTKGQWKKYNYYPTDTSNMFYDANFNPAYANNFHIAISTASTNSLYAKSTLSVDAITVTDGQP